MTTEFHDEVNGEENSTFWTNESKSSRFLTRSFGSTPRIFPALTAAVILILIITLGVINTQNTGRLSSLEDTVSNLTSSLQILTNNTIEAVKDVHRLQFAVETNTEQLTSVSVALRGLSVLEALRKTVAGLKCSLDRLSHNRSREATAGEPCCEAGWDLFTPRAGAAPACYLFSTDALSWDNARDRCGDHSSHLAILRTDEEWAYVRSKSMPVFHWVGLTDERTGKWEWVNQTPYIMDRRYWRPNQPDNWRGGHTNTEDCAHIHSNGLLNDLHCFERLRYICQTRALRS